MNGWWTEIEAESRAAVLGHPTMTPLCEICGIELNNPTERFCGGDRCSRVFNMLPRIGIV